MRKYKIESSFSVECCGCKFTSNRENGEKDIRDKLIEHIEKEHPEDYKVFQKKAREFFDFYYDDWDFFGKPYEKAWIREVLDRD